MPHSWEKQGSRDSLAVMESPGKPGKAPLTPQQLPGILDISIHLGDIGMIRVPPAKPGQ